MIIIGNYLPLRQKRDVKQTFVIDLSQSVLQFITLGSLPKCIYTENYRFAIFSHALIIWI